MAFFLNKNDDKFLEYLNAKIFVDKSDVIEYINQVMNTPDKYMCVTRPRRFGKTMTLSMLNAYYSKGASSKKIFDNLKISESPSYLQHLNQHNVIWLDMASIYTNSLDKSKFIEEIKRKLFIDFSRKYPQIDLTGYSIGDAIVEINSETGDRFIFLIDEWDVIFRENPQSKLCDEYISLLRGLFKGSDVSSCLDLIYMTGILPIKRYSAESTLNMFKEYNMLNPRNLASYIGFTEEEVKSLCETYHTDFEMMKKWYNGYHFKNGANVYNPKSVVEAITEGEFSDYWISTGALESVTNYMDYDNGKLKDVIALMLSGEKVRLDVSLFENDLTKIESRDAALTVLIHLGYLAYDEEKESCYIPNYEILQEFEKAIKVIHWNSIYDPISNSMKLYEETIKGNTSFINHVLDINHKELASMFNKNKEDVLGVVVHISYYRAQEYYYIRKEDTGTLGRADITFVPRDLEHIPMIIKLKVDEKPENAMKQMKEKDYFSVFSGYQGKILLLAITYHSKTLKHDSKIEFIEI